LDEDWLAANEVLALLVILGFHIVLNRAAECVVPRGWERALMVMRTTFFGVFLVTYLHSLRKSLLIFVPVNNGGLRTGESRVEWKIRSELTEETY
jgi:hypothetical protein